jgi:hypothetical protein
MTGCDRIYDLVRVFGVHTNLGRAFLIRFIGINAKPGQFEIVSSENIPLSEGNYTTYSNVTVPFSSNLFYEPIPFEMLRTYETQP